MVKYRRAQEANPYCTQLLGLQLHSTDPQDFQLHHFKCHWPLSFTVQNPGVPLPRFSSSAALQPSISGK
ncbi:hypothetical protein M3J09_009343 [Ascochyta lentis]